MTKPSDGAAASGRGSGRGGFKSSRGGSSRGSGGSGRGRGGGFSSRGGSRDADSSRGRGASGGARGAFRGRGGDRPGSKSTSRPTNGGASNGAPAQHPAFASRDARAELVAECNKLWNELREDSTTEERRLEISSTLIKTKLKGRLEGFVQRPDTSRVIQTAFRYGDSETRAVVLSELATHFATLAKGKHSSFLVLALLRYGSKEERQLIVHELRPQIRALGSHGSGARVVNYVLEASEVVATSSEWRRMLLAMMGGDLLVLEATTSAAAAEFAGSVSIHADVLAPVVAAMSTESKKESTLNQVKQLILKMADKGLLRYAYAQRVAWEYVSASKALPSAKERLTELVPSVTDSSLAMVGTWPGARTVARVFVAADAKDRKKMIKEWKTHVADLATHQFGWLVVCRVADSMDDTVASGKTLADELLNPPFQQTEGSGPYDFCYALLTQPQGFGRKAFLRILSPSSRLGMYFDDFQGVWGVASSEEKDPLTTSVKDELTRRRELYNKLAPTLYKLVAERGADLLRDARASDVVRELFAAGLTFASETPSPEREAALQALAQAVLEDLSLLEDARAHIAIKRIIKDETDFLKEKEAPAATLLGPALTAEFRALTDAKLADLAKVNRAAFVLDALVEHPLGFRDLGARLPAAVSAPATAAKGKKKTVETTEDSSKGTQALLKRCAEYAAPAPAPASAKRVKRT